MISPLLLRLVARVLLCGLGVVVTLFFPVRRGLVLEVFLLVVGGLVLETLVHWAAAGEIDPAPGRVMPLSEAGLAHRILESRGNVGKIVLQV